VGVGTVVEGELCKHTMEQAGPIAHSRPRRQDLRQEFFGARRI